MAGTARAWVGPVRPPESRAERFTLGVASGDPWPDGVVLWTRLASDPVAPDGLGGMPNRPIPVRWQVASDERFGRIAAAGTVITHPAHSVHAEVHGLRPGTDYFYRFRSGREISPVGRTRTAPRPAARTDRFAFASCQNRPDGFYNAYANMVNEDLDLDSMIGSSTVRCTHPP